MCAGFRFRRLADEAVPRPFGGWGYVCGGGCACSALASVIDCIAGLGREIGGP